MYFDPPTLTPRWGRGAIEELFPLIYSMTAFARLEQETDHGHFICDIRSVNHRYLDVNVRLSEVLLPFETLIRDGIREHAKRGKVDCSMRFELKAKIAQGALVVNHALVTELCRVNDEIRAVLRESLPANPADIWRFPGVLETQTIDALQLKDVFLSTFEQTLQIFLAARAREGETILQLFKERIASMRTVILQVKERLPIVMATTTENLLARFKDLEAQLDANRLEQEMVIFAQKIDISEEIDRLGIHLFEMDRVLKEGGLVGRRLDFLLQELNREANTLGSKSVDAVITHAAVELKVLIEQIREQVQNVA